MMMLLWLSNGHNCLYHASQASPTPAGSLAPSLASETSEQRRGKLQVKQRGKGREVFTNRERKRVKESERERERERI